MNDYIRQYKEPTTKPKTVRTDEQIHAERTRKRMAAEHYRRELEKLEKEIWG